MKQLVLVRHARAVQYGYENDFNRSLTTRGIRDAERVSKFLREKGFRPQLMVTSQAARALQTAQIFAGVLSYEPDKIVEERELYFGFSTGELIEYIQEIPDKHEVVFFFGHNPSFTYYATNLCSEFSGEMATSSAVVIDFPVESWASAEAHRGSFVMQVNPKDLSR